MTDPDPSAPPENRFLDGMKPLLMRMEPFYSRFPGVKVMNIEGFRVEKSDVIPAGDYALQEWYCADAGCDCRRVLIEGASAPASQ